jgi:hypothetical protein
MLTFGKDMAHSWILWQKDHKEREMNASTLISLKI